MYWALESSRGQLAFCASTFGCPEEGFRAWIHRTHYTRESHLGAPVNQGQAGNWQEEKPVVTDWDAHGSSTSAHHQEGCQWQGNPPGSIWVLQLSLSWGPFVLITQLSRVLTGSVAWMKQTDFRTSHKDLLVGRQPFYLITNGIGHWGSSFNVSHT